MSQRKPVRWTDNQEHPTPWRSGRSVHRTIYDANEVLIGMMDTGELAAQIIEAVNSFDPNLNNSNTTEKEHSTS